MITHNCCRSGPRCLPLRLGPPTSPLLTLHTPKSWQQLSTAEMIFVVVCARLWSACACRCVCVGGWVGVWVWVWVWVWVCVCACVCVYALTTRILCTQWKLHTQFHFCNTQSDPTHECCPFLHAQARRVLWSANSAGQYNHLIGYADPLGDVRLEVRLVWV